MTATVALYEFCRKNLAQVNLPRVRLLVKQHTRIPAFAFPIPKTISKVLDYAEELTLKATESQEERLINLRDRAFNLPGGYRHARA